MTAPAPSPGSLLPEESPQGGGAVDKAKRNWWLRMLLVSAAIVLVLLAAVALTPPARLHYYAWRWRNRRDGTALQKAVQMIGARGLSRDAVVRLLGKPTSEWPEPGSGPLQSLDYHVEHKTQYGVKFENGRTVPYKPDRSAGNFGFVDPNVDWRRPVKNEDE